MEVRLKQTPVNILQYSFWKKIFAARQSKIGRHQLFIDMVQVVYPRQVFIQVVAKKFKGIIFATLANSGDGFIANQEISHVDMTALLFEQNELGFSSIQGQQIRCKPV